MVRRKLIILTAAAMLNAGVAVLAQESAAPVPATYESLRDLEYPVVAGDITDRPYRIVGRVETDVRKATIFSRSPSQRHVFRELWERAQRMGADAVVNASYGDARVTAMSWGARRASGQAVKFLTDEEIAAGDAPAATSSPAPQ